MNKVEPINQSHPAALNCGVTTLFAPSLYGGRFTRKQYLIHTLILGLLSIVLAVINFLPNMIRSLEISFYNDLGFWGVTFLLSLIYGLPISVKRAHDIGHSGAWPIACWCVNVVSSLILLVWEHDGIFVRRYYYDLMGNFGLVGIVMCVPVAIYGLILLFADSAKGTNAYGCSMKYPDAIDNQNVSEEYGGAPSLYSGGYTRKQYLMRIMVFFLISVLCSIPMVYGGRIHYNLYSWLEYWFGLDYFVAENTFLYIVAFGRRVILVLFTVFLGVPTLVKRAHAIGHNGTMAAILCYLFMISAVLRSLYMASCPAHLYWITLALLCMYCVLLLCSSNQINTYSIVIKNFCANKSPKLLERTKRLYTWSGAHKMLICVALVFAVGGLLSASLYQIIRAYENRSFGINMTGDVVENCDLNCLKQTLECETDAEFVMARIVQPPLYNAIASGNEELVKLLLDNGADAHLHNRHAMGLLNCAVDKGDIRIVRLLIERGAPLSLDNWGIAVSRYVRLKIEDGALIVWFVMDEIRYPLHYAVEKGYTEIANYLIEAGADFKASDGKLLEFAAKEGHVELVKRLIEGGALDDHLDEDSDEGRLLVDVAEKGHTEIVKLLLADPRIDVNKTDKYADKYGDSALHKAEENGHVEVVKLLLLALGVDVNKIDRYVYNAFRHIALDKAAGKGQVEVVKLLLSVPGIDVNKTDVYGNTALHNAAENGHVEIVKLLLSAPGIDVNKTDEYRRTVLYGAARNGHVEVVKLLLSAPGIYVNCCAPLAPAAEKGHVEVVKLLLSVPGIDVNKTDEYGNTALHEAAENGHVEIVKLLLSAPGIDVNHGRALRYAAESGQVEVVKLLLSAPGIDVNHGLALHMAASRRHVEVVKLLLAVPGIDVNKAAKYLPTPLSHAAYKGHTEIVKLLLAAPDIDVNKTVKSGNTPLSHAANKGHTEIVKLLLAVPGIDVNRANKDGYTALSFAEKQGHTEIVELLKAAGATH
ncbi:MAG: ankyrin repeat domain-containing protein [Akkermansia sp.]|nr:ankyrin repeat domain-containing protein [Akkermansia sp.]